MKIKKLKGKNIEMLIIEKKAFKIAITCGSTR